MMKKLLSAAVLALLALVPEGAAQNAITQEGTVLQNSPMMFRGNNRARQGAPVGGAPTGQIVTTGDSVVGGRCDYSDPIDVVGGYYRLCLDADTGTIKLDGTKLPPLATLKIEINGVIYEFPGSAAIAGSDVAVPNNAALKGLNGSIGKRAVRLGFTTPGDGGLAQYNWSADNCPIADDGKQVQPTGATGCWIADFSVAPPNVMVWGAVGDGVTDDYAAFQKAVDAVIAGGGGTLKVPGKVFLLSGGDINLNGVRVPLTIEGDESAYGLYQTMDYNLKPYTIVLPSTRMITIGSHMTVRGLNFIRQGLVKPTSRHHLQEQLDAYAGTALRCFGGDSDSTIEKIGVFGFATPIIARCSRFNLRDIRADSANGEGISGQFCGDLCAWERLHSWPFLMYQFPDDRMRMTITNAVNNGTGKVRITVSAAPVEAIQTGDTLVVGVIEGMPDVGGRYIVSVINNTTFDLDGSTFSGTYSSDGVAYWVPIRKGAAFTATNGIYWASTIETFGQDLGVHVHGSTDVVPTSVPTTFYCQNSCWAESEWGSASFETRLPDKTPTGVLVEGNRVGEFMWQGLIVASGYGLILDSSSARNIVSDTRLVGSYGGSPTVPLDVRDGTLLGSNITLDAKGDVNPALRIGPGATSVRLTNPLFVNGAYDFGDEFACAKLRINGAIGPCAWTPGVSFGYASVGVTYNTGVTQGVYTTSAGGATLLTGRVLLTSKGTSVGDARITGLPVTNGGRFLSSCTVPLYGDISGITEGWLNYIDLDEAIIKLRQTTSTVTNTNFSDTSDMWFQCTLQP